MGVLTSGKFILRAIECLFAIVAFATVAAISARATSWGGFMIFTGVFAFLLTLFFMGVYFSLSLNSKIIGLPELVLSALVVIFFFSASIAVAVEGTSGNNCDFWNLVNGESYACSNLKASTAFGFFSFFLWSISCFFSFRDMRTGGAAASNV